MRSHSRFRTLEDSRCPSDREINTYQVRTVCRGLQGTPLVLAPVILITTRINWEFYYQFNKLVINCYPHLTDKLLLTESQ